MSKPIPQELLDAVVYDPTSPTFLRWKEWRGGGSRRDLQAGGIAVRGYAEVQSREFGRFYAHRIIWALHHGEPGEMTVDHINHDPLDNRIENLQLLSLSENSSRTRMRGTAKGVLFKRDVPRTKPWLAYYHPYGGKFITLGVYATEAEAAQAFADWKAANPGVVPEEVDLEG